MIQKMNENSLRNSFIVSFVIGLYMVFGLSDTYASKAVLHEKVSVRWKTVALQEDDIGYEEERLKRRLGVRSLAGADLTGVDLRWMRLQEANLSGANLQGTDMKATNLRQANLQGADMRGANLSRANMEGTDLRGADLTGVQNLTLKQVFVTIYDKETKFPEGITFENIPKYNKDRLKSALGVKMLEGAKARGMILRWGNFEGVNMQWSSLQEADLTGANLSQTNLSAANLRGANLLDANLEKAILKNSSLQEANLTRANLHKADLTGASLQGANLSGARLHEAKFQSANLTGANLSEADLRSVDLRGADLREVKHTTINQIAQAIVDMRTRLPEGITFKQIGQYKTGKILTLP